MFLQSCNSARGTFSRISCYHINGIVVSSEGVSLKYLAATRQILLAYYLAHISCCCCCCLGNLYFEVASILTACLRTSNTVK